MVRIYLDYAATTPVDPRITERMNEFYGASFGNASSVHSFGREAAVAVDRAREQVSKMINGSFHDIIFTSGATEANNLAILGLVKRFVIKNPGVRFHVITSSIEHSSVRECFAHIQEMNLADVTVIAVDSRGLVNPDDVKNALRDNTILVSIMFANNEIGTIQPLRKIGKIIKKFNERADRAVHVQQSNGDKAAKFTAYDRVYFHADAVQAANYLDLNVDFLHLDLLTLSAHKIYGPKGVGALYVRGGTPISKILYGGDQEFGLRAGTMNVPGIVGMGAACELLTPEFKAAESKRLLDLRNLLVEKLAEEIPEAVINGDLEERLPNNLNISIPGKSGEMMMLQLDQKGIAVSTGSACMAGAVSKSKVLIALGHTDSRVESALRITMGRGTTGEDIETLVSVLKSI